MSYLEPSSGFHSTFISCVSPPSLSPSCSLHALYSLPPLLFVDPNELTQDHDLRTAVDLESPVFNVDDRPTRILYNITKNTAHFHPNGSVCFSLPIHARYGTPSTSRVHKLSIACPQVFSSCPQSRDSRADLGAEDIAPFLHMQGVALRLFQKSTVCAVPLLLPVGDPTVLKDVQLGTTVVLLSVAIYCLSSFINTFLRLKTQETACKQH